MIGVSQAVPGGRIIRFSRFELNERTGELRKSGIRVRLGSQPLEVLRALLEHPGELVTREALSSRLWPDGVHVDFEHNLNKVVNRLRDALGDTAETPRYIETVPRRGYRFLQPVDVRVLDLDESQGGGAVLAGPEATPGKTPGSLRRKWVWVAVALGTAAALWVPLSRKQQPSSHAAAPWTALVGRELSPAFSPSGDSVVFVWEGPHLDNLDLYRLEAGSSRPEHLTNHPRMDYSPAWSPDGKWIAFLRDLDGERSAIVVMPAEGGQERTLTVVVSPPTSYSTFSVPGRSLCWMPDSTTLVASDAIEPGSPHGLVSVRLQDGSIRRLTRGNGPRGDLSPQVSLDGSRVAFLRGGVAQTGAEVWVAEISQDAGTLKRSRRLDLNRPWVDSIAWLAGATTLLVSAARTLDGPREILRVELDRAGAVRSVEPLSLEGTEPAYSPARSRLLFVRHEVRRSSIWRLRMDSPTKVAAPPERIDVSTSSNMDADISPDGSRVAFRSLRSGRPELWIASSETAALKKAVELGAEGYGNPRWSPDGGALTFHARVRGNSDIYFADPERSNWRRLTTDPADDVFPTWARDGMAIFFSSNRSGEYRIYRVRPEGGPDEPVAELRGFCYVESRTGPRAWHAGTGRFPALYEVDQSSGARREIVRALANRSGFAVGRSGIYYLAAPDPAGRSALHYLPSGETKAVPLLRFDHPLESGLSLSQDNRILVYSQVDQEETSLLGVEAFR